MSKVMIVITGAIAAALIGLFYVGNANYSPPAATQTVSNAEAREACMQHTGLGMHIHPEIEILVEGEKQTIPANIGITDACMKAIHTHDSTGKLHIEYTQTFDFLLEDFFAVWGKPFSKEQLLDYQIDENDKVVMTVNGEPSEDFEKLVLKDAQKIVITLDRID